MTSEAEIGVMCLQAKEHQGFLVTPRGWNRQGMIVPESLQRECGLADTLISDFWPPEV